MESYKWHLLPCRYTRENIRNVGCKNANVIIFLPQGVLSNQVKVHNLEQMKFPLSQLLLRKKVGMLKYLACPHTKEL